MYTVYILYIYTTIHTIYIYVCVCVCVYMCEVAEGKLDFSYKFYCLSLLDIYYDIYLNLVKSYIMCACVCVCIGTRRHHCQKRTVFDNKMV